VDNYVLLVPDGRPGPKLLLQRVPEDKAVKNRMHLDIEVPDIAAVAEQLEGRGARRVTDAVQTEHGSSWILMADSRARSSPNQRACSDYGTSVL
jgi:hypothetical protein